MWLYRWPPPLLFFGRCPKFFSFCQTKSYPMSLWIISWNNILVRCNSLNYEPWTKATGALGDCSSLSLFSLFDESFLVDTNNSVRQLNLSLNKHWWNPKNNHSDKSYQDIYMKKWNTSTFFINTRMWITSHWIIP